MLVVQYQASSPYLETTLRTRLGRSARFVLLVAGWLVGAEVCAQVADLVCRLPSAWRLLQQRLGVHDRGQWLAQGAQDGDASAGSVLSSLVGVTTTLGSAFANLLLVAIGGVFFATEPELYRRGCSSSCRASVRASGWPFR
ncbi:MAG: hypothetical protein WAS21_28155 [Geminicoccaceae bacterium]